MDARHASYAKSIVFWRLLLPSVSPPICAYPRTNNSYEQQGRTNNSYLSNLCLPSPRKPLVVFPSSPLSPLPTSVPRCQVRGRRATKRMTSTRAAVATMLKMIACTSTHSEM